MHGIVREVKVRRLKPLPEDMTVLVCNSDPCSVVTSYMGESIGVNNSATVQTWP
jgi:hypothetical protein